MKPQIIQQGAEAIIEKKNNSIIKTRTKKSYRYLDLDLKIRNTRTKKEAKILDKLHKILNIPKLINLDKDNHEITMQFIEGEKLSQHLENLNHKDIAKKIAEQITLLHNQDIIHGDLTTSNMILSSKNNQLYLIDFGLSYHSHKIEDKAVDLHLLKQALNAKHHSIAEQTIKIILDNYKPDRYKEILEKLKTVESRGRYKDRH